MDALNQYFLQVLRSQLHHQPEEIPASFSAARWQDLFAMAQGHKLLPMVYEGAYMTGTLAGEPVLATTRRLVLRQVMEQTVKTSEFLALYDALSRDGLHPLVVKGIVCRGLYPGQELRPSADEDLLIPPAEFDRCCAWMEAMGLVPVGNGNGEEMAFRKPGSPLYVELHTALFPREQSYAGMNRIFDGIFQRALTMEESGVILSVPDHTDHLLYLICHSLKHFIHSGVGIRQVCDVVLYSKEFGHLVDWSRLMEGCRAVRGEVFAAAIFRIGVNHLGFAPDALHLPIQWREMDLSELPLLEDILGGGVYGGTTAARQHSATITLEAAGAALQGETSRSAVTAALFPPAAQLRGRYPYLKKHPWLLPVAWCSRIITHRKGSGEAREALQTGRSRLKLLEQYHITEKT